MFSVFRRGVVLAKYPWLSTLATPSVKNDALLNSLTFQLQEIEEAGKFKEERIITSPQSERIRAYSHRQLAFTRFMF